ncbi:TonB-dependent receptor [Arcticibacter tournemirensis]|uniref:TonB-dependent receptor n=2 Tax=Arcticibacter tournemirensis TaxID=699437 RepID=A0A4Q0MHF6_9SPHI|nr:TonB-dependent receptor [Arcticibacter tournemirensis]
MNYSKIHYMKSCFIYSEAVRGLHRRLLFMRQSTFILLVFFLSCFSQFVLAQTIAVSGKVTDEKGESLIGVSVRLKGTRTATSTNARGEYSLSLPNGSGSLVFTYIGFSTKEVPVNNRTSVNVTLTSSESALEEVVVVGYGTQKKESVTGAISSVTSKDLDRVHGGSTVSSGLAGKLPGVSFRMADGRPGASANIQIRNLGNPLYVIDGIQQDAGQFNNISPTDIESISVLKDASAAIYGVRAANGVVVVTTKRGKTGTRNSVSLDAYTGWQNWSRFPETVNSSYDYMLSKADAEMNSLSHSTNITLAELEKYRQGTEYGYQSFNWKDFIVQGNAPLTSVNLNATGGSDKINYYLSATRLDQQSVLGREFTFDRSNIQSNVDAKIAESLKVGVQINGRIETRDNPGVPGGDDYWQPRFAILRNLPTERPFANDNPAYINDIGHNETNWGYLNKELAGYWREEWRVLQTNFNVDYQVPWVKGLSARGVYSYYIADKVMNGHEYTYETYTYNPADDTYRVTGGSTNPWRERGTEKKITNTYQAQLNYNNTFGKHTVGATFATDWIEKTELNTWVHAVPATNVLPLIYFTTMDRYDDGSLEEARIGYIGRLNYSYSNKYYFEVSGRRDASWKFAPGKRVGYFPSVSAGWRVTEEDFAKKILGDDGILNDLKFRASYGIMGDDDIGIGAYDYLPGYNYGNVGTVVLSGNAIITARDKGIPVDQISWFKSRMFDVGADFSLLNNKVTGVLDYFYRKRTGLRGRKYDELVPSEIGYTLPEENVNSDAVTGYEAALNYQGNSGDLKYTVGVNFSFARPKSLNTYKPLWGNSLEHYRTSVEDRWSNIMWGYETAGQFQSQEEINSYPVNIDGKGNSTLLPGDLIYKDQNGDGRIDGYDERPIGYTPDRNPVINYGLSFTLGWKSIDFSADFSGGSLYTFTQNWEMRWPFQNNGALLKQFYEDRWHRADPFDVNSQWIPGTYPALRYNDGDHSNYNRLSTFWTTNVWYLRARTIELGYTLPKEWIQKVKIQRARLYVNCYNLFSIDNMKKVGVEPEIIDPNGLQYPQNRFVNLGVNLSL